jgi:hypothetical protein
VVLDHCIFGQPSTVSFAQLLFRERQGGLTPEGGLGRELFTEEEEKEADKRVRHPKPRLLSMRGVDVSNLTLVELDLRPCLFQGVHKRAELRIVGARPFADTPKDRARLFGDSTLAALYEPTGVGRGAQVAVAVPQPLSGPLVSAGVPIPDVARPGNRAKGRRVGSRPAGLRLPRPEKGPGG